MKHVKEILKQINDVACNDGGLLLGSCKSSLNGNKNYFYIIGGALVAQYVLPIIMLLIIAPFLAGTIVAFGVIEFLEFFNPFFVLLYLPVMMIDAVFAGIMIILFLIGCAIFWYFYFKEIGVFMLIPVVSWLLAIILWFMPVIGPFISVTISIMPWLPLMSLLHWHVYK
jgi:hypothetical protein